MSEAIDIRRVYDEILELKKDISYIKKNMIDPDIIMTAEEGKRFDESIKELQQGKTSKLSALKKELGI